MRRIKMLRSRHRARMRKLRLQRLRRHRARMRRIKMLRSRHRARMRKLRLQRLRRHRARMRRLKLQRLRRHRARMQRIKMQRRRHRARMRRLRLQRLRRHRARMRRIKMLRRRHRARMRRLKLQRLRRHRARMQRIKMQRRRHRAKMRRLRLQRLRRHRARMRRIKMLRRRHRARMRKLRMQRRRKRQRRRRRRRRGRGRRRRRRGGRGRRRRRRRRRRRLGKKRDAVVHSKQNDRLQGVKKTPIPDFYWSFNIKLAQPTHDVIHNQEAELQDGANIVISHGKGSVAETKSTKNASISLGDFKGKCFSDPDTCKGKGMTVMTSIKLDNSTLSSNSSSYIMSTGGQTTKARGFALVHTKNQYVLILGTKAKQWILNTPSLPADWFNLAFTWENGGQLKLFVNGKVVASSKPLPVVRLQDMFTSFTIGRPNNSNTLKYKLGLEVGDVTLWEAALTDQQILDVFKSGVHLPGNQSKAPLNAKPN